VTGRRLPWLLLGTLLGLSGCHAFGRAVTYLRIDPILHVGWYHPWESVPGDPSAHLKVASPGEHPYRAAVLEAAWRDARQRRSCALLVLHEGRIVLERYACGLGPSSLLNTMSLSKTVVALLVGIAIREGRIRSEADLVSAYLPEWARGPRRRITVRHLLQMTSGLRVAGTARLHLSRDVTRIALATPVRRPPGQVFEYGNHGTQVLSTLLQRVTGERFAQYLSDRLWRPLGAGDARVWLDRPGGAARSYCCLLATARDWARVGLLLAQRGVVHGRQVVPAGWIDRMVTPSPREENYGYHVWLGRTWPERHRKHWSEPFLAPDTIIAMGRGDQRVYAIPSRRLVVVRLGRAARPWDDPALPNRLIRGADRVTAP
jgi:CubicO group peptidase (beta-lactamase class C family)